MCGIIGYTGKRDAVNVLLQGLKKLEYRGYDSAGIAITTDKKDQERVISVKSAGKLTNLEKYAKEINLPESHCGIGHTRWATHGAPNNKNAHPHTSGKVTIVHNGIIENDAELRSVLVEKGYKFVSDTDTEVLAAWIDYQKSTDPCQAISAAIQSLKGSYALAIIFSDDKSGNTIYAVRKDSPMLIGKGENECFIASDLSAVLPYTNQYYLPKENQIVKIEDGGITFYDSRGVPCREPELHIAEWNAYEAERDGHPHFMHKEIFEQPETLSKTLHAYAGNGIEHMFEKELPNLENAERLIVIGCGSAMHAGLIGKTVIERISRIPVDVCIASEFRYSNPIFRKGDAVIIISQSGETADSLAALRLAKENAVPVFGIVNVIGSTIARECDAVLYTRVGPEIAVATTKAFTAQVLMLELFAIRLGYLHRTLKKEECEEKLKELYDLPETVRNLISESEKEIKFLPEISKSEDAFFIGRGQDYGVCCEGSLKLKEISYIHSEAYAAGELKHGTISLITDGTPCVSVAADALIVDKTRSNIKEIKSRGAHVTVICPYEYAENFSFCDRILTIPSSSFLIQPFLSVIILQLAAYHISVERGCDVDKPRNLAKSVTVE